MRIPVHNHDQWVSARSGKITASKAHVVMNGSPAALTTYLDQLRGERDGTIGFDDSDFKATRWGREFEPEARNMLAIVIGKDIEPPPIFFAHDEWPDDVGASPDGMVDGAFPLEIKCPFGQDNHERLRLGPTPEYFAQVQFQLLCTGARQAVFASYDPRATNSRGVRVGDLVWHEIPAQDDVQEILYRRTKMLVEHLRNGTNPERFDPKTPGVPRFF